MRQVLKQAVRKDIIIKTFREPKSENSHRSIGGVYDPSNFSRWRRDFFADNSLGYFEHEEIRTDLNDRIAADTISSAIFSKSNEQESRK